MRNWRAMLVVAMLAVTVPLVLAGCKGQAGTPSSKTAAATPNEHEGHDHEEAAAKSEETPFEEHATSDKVARLLEDLQSADDHRIVEALEGIIQIKVADERDQLKDAVRKLLLSPDSSAEVRVAAITAWKAWVATDPDPVLKAAQSPEAPVRAGAADALRKVKGPKVIEVLEKLKTDPDSSVKSMAAEVLAEHLQAEKSDNSIDLLIADLGHPDGDRSAQAGMKLEQRGRDDRRVATKLMATLRTSPSAAQRESCATVLALCCAGTSPGQRKFASSVKATFRANANPPPAYEAATPALIEALEKDPDPIVREAAAFGLGMLGSADAAKPLGRALSDPDPYVRRRAAAALIVVPPDGVQDQLKQSALHDPSPDVRRFAVEAMSNLKGDEAGYAVAACLRDPDAQVRLYACEVLKKIGTRKQTDALLRLFEDPDEDVRWKAVDAVAQFADPDAKDALIAALSDPSARVAQAAERGVHRLGIGARVLTKEERLGLGPRR
jgi:HEAT repeat protein